MHQTWRVEYKWGLQYRGALCDGLCDKENRVIYLRRELSKEEKFSTFVHEFIHAVFAELEPDIDLWPEDEETITNGLTEALLVNFKMRVI